MSYRSDDQSRYRLASALGGLAFKLVLNRQFAEAQTRCEEAQKLANAIGEEVNKTDRDNLIFIQMNLAHALLFPGHYDEALAIYRQNWDKPLHRKTFGEVTQEDFAALEKAGLTHPDLSRMKQILGDSNSKTLSLRSDDDDLLALNQQTHRLFEEGKYHDAIPLSEKAIELAKRIYGPKIPKRRVTLTIWPFYISQWASTPKPSRFTQEALRIRQKMLGPEDPATAKSLNDLADLYQSMRAYAKAEPLYQEALRIRQKVLGPEDPATAKSLNDLADLYQSMRAYAKAEPLYQEALRIRQKVLGPEDPATAHCLNDLADLYKAMIEYAKAEPLYQEALRIRQKVLGSENLDTALSLNNLAVLYWVTGETQEPNRSSKKCCGSDKKC